MSLNFDLTKIADRETNYPPQVGEKGQALMNPVTYAVIWSTISTDIGHLKNEDTAREAFRRWQALGYDVGADDALTVEHFIGHIGLRTNVFNTGKRDFAAKLKRIEAQRKRDAEYAAAAKARAEAAA